MTDFLTPVSVSRMKDFVRFVSIACLWEQGERNRGSVERFHFDFEMKAYPWNTKK